MKMKKRILSLALAGTMALGLMPGMTMTALAGGDTSYTLTIPSTLTVANSGWNATDGISATGSLADGMQLTVTATSDDEFALVNQDNDTQKVGYQLATASTDTQATTSWTFNTLSDTATTQPMGIIVEDYSDKPAGTYQDTVIFTAKVEEEPTAETALQPLLNDNATLIVELTDGDDAFKLSFEKANGSFSCTGITMNNESVTPQPVIDQGYTADLEEGTQGYGALAVINNDYLIVWLVVKTENRSFSSPYIFGISSGTYYNDTVTSVKVNGTEVFKVLTYKELESV